MKKKSSNSDLKRIDSLILNSVVFPYGPDGDAPCKIMDKTCIVLDFLEEGENPDPRVTGWNNLFYKYLGYLYRLTEKQFNDLSDILNLDSSSFESLSDHWPKDIDHDLYKKIFEKLQLKFVTIKKIEPEQRGKFCITINPKFWSIPTFGNYNLIIDIIDTYERNFLIDEFIHSDLNDATENAILLMDYLCNSRAPDNGGFYHKQILNQIEKLPENDKSILLNTIIKYDLPFFDFHPSGGNLVERLNHYKEVRDANRENINLMRKIFSKIEITPFRLLKI